MVVIYFIRLYTVRDKNRGGTTRMNLSSPDIMRYVRGFFIFQSLTQCSIGTCETHKDYIRRKMKISAGLTRIPHQERRERFLIMFRCH